MAFLVGESKEKRIAVNENAVEVYRHRSGFISSRSFNLRILMC